MPRTCQAIPNASIMFGINDFRINTMNGLRTISIPTTSSRSSRSRDGERLPMVEHGYEGWAQVQAFIHDIDVVYCWTQYQVFVQRHKRLSVNPVLGVHGEIVVMRVGTVNPQNVVHSRVGDKRRAQNLARLLAPYVADFQQRGQGLQPFIQL